MSDIDDEVAAFAARMEATVSVDAAARQADTVALNDAILTARSHDDAAAAVLRFGQKRAPWPVDYRRKIILGVLCSLTVSMTIHGTDAGVRELTERLRACVLAARTLGLADGDE